MKGTDMRTRTALVNSKRDFHAFCANFTRIRAYGGERPACLSLALNLRGLKRHSKSMTRMALIVIFLAFVARGFAQSGPDTGTVSGLELVQPSNTPAYATFWFTSTLRTNGYFGPPLPWNPFDGNTNVPIYRWPARGNSYVVDDTVLPPEQ